nr:hypothetical protein [uncultured Flavobacterium sp.]
MTLDQIKQKIATLHQNGQVINAVFWLLKKYNLKNANLKGFEFREKAKPDFILMTTEGDFGKPQIIRIPENTFEFPLELMLILIVHEMVHVNQKTIKPYVLDKNEREWKAYYEMNFNILFPQIPEISTFHKKFFAQKGLEYYQRMGEGSELQQKYARQKKQVEDMIASLQ